MLQPSPPHRFPPWLQVCAFCAAYLLLDWASYIDPLHQFNITPWNPAPALGILYLLRRGAGGRLTLLAAIVASDLLIRNLAHAAPQILVPDALLAFGYTVMALLLGRYVPESGMFSARASLARWVAIVVAGSLANSLLFVTALVGLGLMPAGEWSNAVVRFWIGDGVGIFVAFPLFWWLQDRPRRQLFRIAAVRIETAGYVGLMVLLLWLTFAPGTVDHSRYLYALVLPVVWAASRQGIVGAVFCASLLQLGMLLAGMIWDIEATSIFELQIRALLFAGIGFVIGAAVDEERRAVTELHQTLRLAAAGEMAAALAHELNQPLTALSAYGSACELLIAEERGSPRLADTIRRMVGEAERAADVVRRLRDFFRTGSTKLEIFPLAELIDVALRPFKDKAAAAGYQLNVGALPAVRLNADRLQIEVVLRNLLSNAVDAIASLPANTQRIDLTASLVGGDQLCIRVTDNGPGLSAAQMDGAFEPFVSTKSSGLGLGLAISRAIAETHGGRLVAETSDHGSFALFLPAIPTEGIGNG